MIPHTGNHGILAFCYSFLLSMVRRVGLFGQIMCRRLSRAFRLFAAFLLVSGGDVGRECASVFKPHCRLQLCLC